MSASGIAPFLECLIKIVYLYLLSVHLLDLLYYCTAGLGIEGGKGKNRGENGISTWQISFHGKRLLFDLKQRG